jgi:hypothetical protein
MRQRWKKTGPSRILSITQHQHNSSAHVTFSPSAQLVAHPSVSSAQLPIPLCPKHGYNAVPPMIPLGFQQLALLLAPVAECIHQNFTGEAE